ncbi:MAG: circadian clock KaiB family protein [Kiloniellales bacterium]
MLKLFITGRTARSELAVRNLERICERDLGGRFELVVIDILEQPDEAQQGRILATPTVVKELPPPMRRVVGDLSDKQKVLAGLGLQPAP